MPTLYQQKHRLIDFDQVMQTASIKTKKATKYPLTLHLDTQQHGRKGSPYRKQVTRFLAIREPNGAVSVVKRVVNHLTRKPE